MKKLLVQRIIPVLLAVVLMCPVFVIPASAIAVSPSTIVELIEAAGTAASLKDFFDCLKSFWSNTEAEDFGIWATTVYYVPKLVKAGYCTDYTFQTLDNLAADWNQRYGYGVDDGYGTDGDGGYWAADVGYNEEMNYNYVRMRAFKASGKEFSRELALVYPDGTLVGGFADEGESSDRWIKDSGIMSDTPRRLLSYEALNNKAQDYNGLIIRVGNYYMIYNKARDQVLASPVGIPYSAQYNPDQWASGSDRGEDSTVLENGIVIEGDVEGNMTNIDLGDMTLTLPDGSINFIDQIIYDEGTKTYHIDAHDEYNSTVNNYYTWNYHINYTSITYIGQTEEYNKYYEVYYELPDGRDSADLTKEDLEQLNVTLDVLPYTRAVDDVSLKSLYHFDGDTRDSSYWNYKTDFTWNSGASVTYMDAAAFEGALYLDETAHDFTFMLPCFVGSEFTMQWRYYQSATAAPVTDSYLRFGSTDVLKFNGSQILTGAGLPICAMPVGTWNEICLTGHGTSLYVYLNGVRIATYPSTGFHSSKVNFHFGSEQQTFKYFDEFRFLSKDLYGAGANYTPTAVPHDTNLTLVLPDSENIVADEWIQWVPGKDTTLVLDFTQGNAMDDRGLEFVGGEAAFGCEFEFTEQGLLITRTDDSTGEVSTDASGLYIDFGVLLPDQNCYYDYVICTDSVPFGSKSYIRATDSGNTIVFPYSFTTSGYSFRHTASGESSAYDAVLYPIGKSVCISRIELAYSAGGGYVTQMSTPIQHSTISAIDSSSMHVPSLAVRTDLKITDFQIGGVRPSVPTKGLVWALVENQRITSIQIYNGQAWESCDGRIWTGERWIPASSYNIVTLQDMYDIVDATPDYEYIYTESGFWSWWQKSWNAFTEKLFSLLGAGGTGGSSGATGGSGSIGLKDVDLDEDAVLSDPDQEDSKSLWQFIVLVIDGGKSVVGGVRHLFSGVVSTIPDTMDGITGAFDSGGVAVGLVDGTGADPDVSVETYSAAEGEVLDPWRYR